ncbi:Uncharacterised protein [Vibrio cholerae]|nr:Uncharacterised protein [Vibrio cholerae]
MTARTLIGVLFQAAIFGWWMAKFLMAAQSSGICHKRRRSWWIVTKTPLSTG